MNVKAPVLEVWQCPVCPWFRVRHLSEKWNKQEIDHPLYGRVRNQTVFEKETGHHNCREIRNARIRHGFDPNLQYTDKYEQRTNHGQPV